MPDKVVDASAVAAYLFAEPGHDAVLRQISGCALFAPELIWFEIAQVCVKKAKSHEGYIESLLEAFDQRAGLEIALRPVDGGAVVRLALEQNLSAYDASYLWLARHMDLELVSLDKKLSKAAA